MNFGEGQGDSCSKNFVTRGIRGRHVDLHFLLRTSLAPPLLRYNSSVTHSCTYQLRFPSAPPPFISLKWIFARTTLPALGPTPLAPTSPRPLQPKKTRRRPYARSCVTSITIIWRRRGVIPHVHPRKRPQSSECTASTPSGR